MMSDFELSRLCLKERVSVKDWVLNYRYLSCTLQTCFNLILFWYIIIRRESSNHHDLN